MAKLDLSPELEEMRKRWMGKHPPTGAQARADVAALFEKLDETHEWVHEMSSLTDRVVTMMREFLADQKARTAAAEAAQHAIRSTRE